MEPVINSAPDAALFSKVLTHSGMWSGVIARGKTLRLTDLQGGANVGMLLYNADQAAERYNMPDTLKGQHIFHLRHPFCLHSDMGRLLAAITADTTGWHDTVCGCTDAALVQRKYGFKNYQQARNDFFRNGRDCFLIELAKWNLGGRDLLPNVNFFSKVVADEAGRLAFVPGHSNPGDFVELRLEMNTLVILNTCQHPLDPDPHYHPRDVRLDVFPAAPRPENDPCRQSRPENARAFRNNEDYFALRD